MKGMSSVLETQADALRVLLVGGSPQTCDAVFLKHLYAGCDLVVAVDRGLDAVLDAGLPCDLFCGDADSVGARGLLAVRRCEEGEPSEVLAVERYDPYKDFTDLSLALRAIDSRWGSVELVCTCLTGGRPDHALAALGCILRWDGKDFTDLSLALRAIDSRWGSVELVCTCLTGGRPDHALAALGCILRWDGPVRLEEQGFSGRLLRAGASWQMTGFQGSTFSFVCLSPVGIVSERGMEWELDHKRVELLSDLGISNIVTDDAEVTCHEGAIAAYLIR